jgi:ABC-type transport system involved in multi-copper enzyme maturation permease subunit
MNGHRPIPFLGLCGAEWRKIRGRGLVWAVLLVGLVHGLVAPLLIKGMLMLGYQSAAPGAAELVDPVDWLVAGDLALSFAVFPVNGFAVLLLAAIMWSEDFSLGTMAMIFVRPVARWKVFASKAVVAWGVGVMSLLLALVIGLGLGVLLLGFSGDVSQLASVPWVGWMAEPPATASGAPTAMASGLRAWRIFGGLGAGILMLGPIVAVAAFVGAVARSPIWTLSGSIVLITIDFFVWAFSAGWGASNIQYADVAGAASQWTIWGSRRFYRMHGLGDIWSEGWSSIAITCGWTALFGGLALWLFTRRDVT